MITNTVETKLDFNPELITEQLRTEINQALLPLAIEILNGIQTTVPIAFGNLQKTFDIIPSQDPKYLGYQVGTPLAAISYASYVEWDTRPHFPPFEPIRLWVEKKIQPHILAVGIDYSSRHKRFLPSKTRRKELHGVKRTTEIDRVAHAIQWFISHHGTKGKHFMMNVLSRLGLKFVEYHTNIDSGYTVDVTEYLKNNLSKLNLN